MKYLIYDPIDGDYYKCETIEEARELCKESFLQDGEYDENTDGFKIYKLEEVIDVKVIAKRENFTDEEWEDEGYSTIHEEIWEHKFIKNERSK